MPRHVDFGVTTSNTPVVSEKWVRSSSSLELFILKIIF
jgi:hypothetical protein